MEERTIAVTGSGSVRVAPDRAQLLLTVTGEAETFSAAVAAAQARTAAAAQALEQCGIAARAAGMNVQSRFEYVRENGEQVRRQTGYTAARRLHAQLAADPARLAAALHAVAESGADPEYGVTFTCSDADRQRRRAAALAVRDAKKRAEALAKAAGVTLGKLRRIESGAPRPFPAVCAMAARADALSDLAPEETELTEDVTVLFDIV